MAKTLLQTSLPASPFGSQPGVLQKGLCSSFCVDIDTANQPARQSLVFQLLQPPVQCTSLVITAPCDEQLVRLTWIAHFLFDQFAGVEQAGHTITR